MPKSTSAIKVSDSDKAWNRKSKSGNYRIETIPINKTILIVCEGQTEKLYFEAFPVLAMRVEAINLGGQSKLKLVESTIEIIKSSDKEYDEIWCVFDMDVRRGADEFADFDNSIIKALQLGYKVAYSNDSFELWFFLHYHFIDSQQLRTFYYKALSKKFGLKYDPDGKKYNFCLKIYKILLTDNNSSQDKAIERAMQLFEKQKDLPWSKQNPVTKVYELVEELNRNLRN